MSFPHCLALAKRSALSGTSRRLISSTRVSRQEATANTPSIPTLGTVKPHKPIGAFRGGIFGFLLGFSVASALASYHLLEEYQHASTMLQQSVEELQVSTQKMSAHVQRIEAVEKELKILGESTARKEDVSKLRAEMKKLYDGLHVEFLDVRSYVWGMQQDIHTLSKRENSSTHI